LALLFLCRNVPGFLLSFLHHSFLFQRIPFFHEIFTFEFPIRFASFDSVKSMPMISPTQRTLFQSLTSILKRTMARGWGGGRVNCGRVHAIFNQEITPSEPHPILILFDLLHCYKKLIHAVGDHHRPRKNARSLRTLRLWPTLMSTA